MNLYEIRLDIPDELELTWLAEQCEKRTEKSPRFMRAVSEACRNELEQRQNGNHGTLIVPWLLDDDEKYYQEACEFACRIQLITNKHRQLTLRNMLGAIQEILFHQVDQRAIEMRVLN